MSSPELHHDSQPIPTAESAGAASEVPSTVAVADPAPAPAASQEAAPEPAGPAPAAEPTTAAALPASQGEPAAPATVQDVPRPAPPIQRPAFVSREERDRRKREALSSLKVGEWREGKVTGIAAFGAFVDLGGVDGLVHVSQLGTGGFVERVEDVVQVGLVVRVRVAEVDTERGRVSLSMREPRPAGAPMRDRPSSPGGNAGAAGMGGAPSMAPSGPRPAGPRPAAPFGSTPTFMEAPPEGRPDRRVRSGGGGGDRPAAPRNDERPRRTDRPARRGRDTEDEDWRTVRGDARNYLSLGDDAEEEPAPQTAEELVARFGRKGSTR